MKKNLRRATELLVLTGAVAYLFSLFGYSHAFVPEAALFLCLPGLVFALFYGFSWALAALLLNIGGVCASFLWFKIPLVPLLFWLEAGSVFVLLVVTIRTFTLQAQQTAKRRFRDLIGRLHRIKRENLALRRASLLLENRLAQQKRFAPFLLERLNNLDRLDLNLALHEVLELTRIFIGVEKASIWWPDLKGTTLSLGASLGWQPNDGFPVEKPFDGSIEGWVFRNAERFSIRMAAGFDHYRKMKPERNILTQPIYRHDRVWGVFNVESLPFALYSPYAESVLEVILKLSEKFLEPIIEHEEQFLNQETDPLTGLPSVSVFFKTLETRWERLRIDQGRVSVVILEFSELKRDTDPSSYENFVRDFLTALQKQFQLGWEAFHYKDFGQFALIVPGLDNDGAALLCLKILGFYNENFFQNSRSAAGELFIGYASAQATGQNWELLSDQAERLLTMQRL
jgi:GGDEF domain-containing protein